MDRFIFNETYLDYKKFSYSFKYFRAKEVSGIGKSICIKGQVGGRSLIYIDSKIQYQDFNKLLYQNDCD